MQDATTSLKNGLLHAGSMVAAVVVGYAGATYFRTGSLLFIAGCLGILLLPVMLRYRNEFLVASWKASIVVFFLPGDLPLWCFMAAMAVGFAILDRAMTAKWSYFHDPPMTWSLIALTVVIVITAKLTGGIGMRSLGGSSYGGKRYLILICAILGYFALCSFRMNEAQKRLLPRIFFLSGLTSVVNYIVFALGPSFYFLFAFFPPEYMGLTSMASGGELTAGGVSRLAGLANCATAVCFTAQLHWGVGGLMDYRKPWRAALYLAFLALGMFSGFRSVVGMIGLVFIFQFIMEGRWRSRSMLVLLSAGAIGYLALLASIQFMPLAVQRAVSFLPGMSVHAFAESDARASSDWRFEMWKTMVPELPKYFILGKGYGIDPVDMYFAEQEMIRGMADSYEPHMISGDYHSGPLSVYVPFGIFGVLAFLAVIASGWRVLYLNFFHGDPSLRLFNSFFLAFYTLRVFSFLLVFGALNSDLYEFLGLVGLSIAVNHGVARRSPALPALT